MESKIQLSDAELIEAKTHLNLIKKAHHKVEAAQYFTKELEDEFRELINGHIHKGGGNPELQYALDTETGLIERVMVEE